MTNVVYTQAVLVSTDDEGIQHSEDGPLHNFDCPCRECRVYADRMQNLAEVYVERTCEGDDCQGCPDCPDVPFGRPAADILAERAEELHSAAVEQSIQTGGDVNVILAGMERTPSHSDYQPAPPTDAWLRQIANAYTARQPQPFRLPRYAQLVTLSDEDEAPAEPMLVREDGATIFYAGKLNVVAGEPGGCKSWVVVECVRQTLERGGRVTIWDFEDVLKTFAQRLKDAGGRQWLGNENLIMVDRTVADALGADPDALAEHVHFVSQGKATGMVAIDSAESAGLAPDNNNTRPWYIDHVDPFLAVGVGVLLVDHVPKQRIERPPGPIGSQGKRARLDGACLIVGGRPWTKGEDGAIALRVDKDRGGDLPAPQGKVTCIIKGEHVNGVLRLTVAAPDANTDATDLTAKFLAAIVAAGDAGISGQKGIRSSIKGNGKAIDAALSDLLAEGLVVSFKNGRRYTYVATEWTLEPEVDGSD